MICSRFLPAPSSTISYTEAGQKFCGECGAALGGAEPAAPRAAPEAGARKIVTIVFADLVGSTALHERLDAEAVRQFIEGYYAAMRGAVEALQVERVGHGIRSSADPELLALLREREVTLDVCPSSNVRTGAVASLAEHPLRELVEAGVRVTLNTDDPTFFHTTLTEEYRRAGFVMWSNDDESGATTSALSLAFSLCLLPVAAAPTLWGFASWPALAGGVAVTLWLIRLAWTFFRERSRRTARRLFLATLAYLPLVLLFLLVFAR